MQPWHNGRYCCKPLFVVETTSIVSTSVIYWAVYPLPLTPQPNCTQWYMSQPIVLNAVILFDMWIIQFNASISCCTDILQSAVFSLGVLMLL